MFHIWMSVYVACLFVLLTPGVVIRLPARSSILTMAMVHGVLFALVYHFSHKLVWSVTYGKTIEGHATRKPTKEEKK